MNEPKILCSSVSPNGNIEAVAEEDDRVVYFYLFPQPGTSFSMKSCWVRNLATAPENLDVDGIRQGMPPLLPRSLCRHPEGRQRSLRKIFVSSGSRKAMLRRYSSVRKPWPSFHPGVA